MCAAPIVELRADRYECADECGFVNYDNPTPVAAVVVEYEGKVVLANNSSWRNDFYGLITGFVDHCESPAECAVREVKEELEKTVAVEDKPKKRIAKKLKAKEATAKKVSAKKAPASKEKVKKEEK